MIVFTKLEATLVFLGTSKVSLIMLLQKLIAG